jgi:hypothetical protein
VIESASRITKRISPHRISSAPNVCPVIRRLCSASCDNINRRASPFARTRSTIDCKAVEITSGCDAWPTSTVAGWGVALWKCVKQHDESRRDTSRQQRRQRNKVVEMSCRILTVETTSSFVRFDYKIDSEGVICGSRGVMSKRLAAAPIQRWRDRDVSSSVGFAKSLSGVSRLALRAIPQ